MPEVSETIVATDAQRIYDAVCQFGGKAVMTGPCTCGTERVYAASKDISCDIVLNVQGDEPLIQPAPLRQIFRAFSDPSVSMATLKTKLQEEDLQDSSIVKVVTNHLGNALYFSRAPIPHCRGTDSAPLHYRHIGVYAYTKSFLEAFVQLPAGILEQAESLEQLRALEHGHSIRVMETDYQSIGVDLPEHIALVEHRIKELS